MGQELPPNQIKLYKRIDEILFYKWDPIGISDADWSRDEYQSYLPQVFQLALNHDDPEPIAEYLDDIIVKQMGLASGIEHDLKIAKLILEIKDRYLE